jgi:hypothetical protein
LEEGGEGVDDRDLRGRSGRSEITVVADAEWRNGMAVALVVLLERTRVSELSLLALTGDGGNERESTDMFAKPIGSRSGRAIRRSIET